MESKNKIFYENDYLSDSNGIVQFELDCNKVNCGDKLTHKVFTRNPGSIQLRVKQIKNEKQKTNYKSN